jgi:hypothetical protein
MYIFCSNSLSKTTVTAAVWVLECWNGKLTDRAALIRTPFG